MAPYSTRQLLDEEDRKANLLRGIDPTAALDDAAPAVSVDDLGSPDDIPPASDESEAKLDAPVALPEISEPKESPLEQFKRSLLAKFQVPQAAPTTQVGPSPATRASAALYAGLTRQRVPDYAFGTQATTKGDPFAAFKAELMAQKFAHDLDKDQFGREFKDRQQDEKERQNAAMEMLRAKGLISQEAMNEWRRTNGDRMYDLGVTRADDARQSRQEVAGRFAATNLANMYKQVKEDVPVAFLLKDIETNNPGLITGSVRSLVGKSHVNPQDVIGDDKTSPADALNFWSRAKERLPKGLGTRLEPVERARLKSAVQLMEYQFAHGLAGANYTKLEQDKIAGIFHSALLDSPEAQAAALDMVRQLEAQKFRQAEAGFRPAIEIQGPEVFDRYKALGGITSEDPIFQMDSNMEKTRLSQTPTEALGEAAKAVGDTASDAGHVIKQKAAPVVQKVKDAVDGVQEVTLDEAKAARFGVPPGSKARRYKDGKIEVYDPSGKLIKTQG